MVQTNDVYSSDDQNCTFHDPRGRGSCAGAWPYQSCSEHAFIPLNIFFFTHRHRSETKYKVIMSKEGYTKIVIFMTPGAGVLVLGCGHIYTSYSENALFL